MSQINLTKSQKEAVEHGEGPLLTILRGKRTKLQGFLNFEHE